MANGITSSSGRIKGEIRSSSGARYNNGSVFLFFSIPPFSLISSVISVISVFLGSCTDSCCCGGDGGCSCGCDGNGGDGRGATCA